VLAILLVINGECHQVNWRVLVRKLGRWNLLPIGKKLDVAKAKLLCVPLSFAMVGVFSYLQEKKKAISMSSPTALSHWLEVFCVVL